MFQADAPLLMNPWPCWHKYSWMAEFVSQIPKYKANTVETVRLAISARQLLLEHAKQYACLPAPCSHAHHAATPAMQTDARRA
jgi:hypothetical protein